MSNFLKKTIIYLSVFGLATISFVSLFWSNIYFINNGLFFRAAFLILIVVSILALLLFYLRYKKIFFFELLLMQDIFLICIIFVFINWQIYGLVPFNVMRSNSIIILDYLYFNNAHPVSKIEVENYVKEIYFSEYDSINVRLNEQVEAGNAEKLDGGWVITDRGRKVAYVMNLITNLYNPERTNFKHVSP